MTPNIEPLPPSKQAGSTNGFVVGAESRDPSARSLLPRFRAPLPEGLGHRYRISSPTLRPSFLGLLRGSGVPGVRYVEDGDVEVLPDHSGAELIGGRRRPFGR